MKTYTRIQLLALLSLPLAIAASAYEVNGITFTPIEHATMIIQTKDSTIYVDPVGDMKLFQKFPPPDIILLTDIHRDHLSVEIVNSLKKNLTTVIGPPEAVASLKHGEAMKNGDKKTFGNISIEAVPMYNLTKERLNFHPKGRGNGYVLTINKKKVYISGDTEDIAEMRSLKNIDYAFICMNLPYTMTVDQAASAVLDFTPKVVIPYHYRGKGMISDLHRFKRLVSKNNDIEVKLLDWYQ
jgi:L-ascorbate metabolism protein UlaG (beta-lactamase superfamily)